MQFVRKCLLVQPSVTSASQIYCFEHEIPIKQVIFGRDNVSEGVDTLGITGAVPGDFDLEQEWERLMENPRLIEVSEGVRTPAPLVAFPRGVRDLEDFYDRRNRNEPVKVAAPEAEETQLAAPKGLPNAKEQRAAAKARLDALGVEYKGNASTESLLELLEDVDGATTDADVQDEG